MRALYGVEVEPEVVPAPAQIEADYACNVALQLAKTLKRAPMEIAEEIKGALMGAELNEALREENGQDGGDEGENEGAEDKNKNAEAQKWQFDVSVSRPGFVNFISSDEYLLAEIDDLGADFEKNISSDEFSGKTMVCEFSDPNPFKVLHVGHLYTSIVGDAISRLYEYAGAKVVRANFGGDVGLHVAKTMYALLKKPNLEDLQIEDIAECYVEGTRAYEEDEAAKAEITRLNKEIYRINAEDLHDSELAEVYWRGRELSYEYFKDFYARIGVKFDKFYPESSVAELGLTKVKEELAAGVYEKSEGAVVFDGEKYGLHTRVFINREGVPTYETKDVGLIFAKWADWHFDRSVVITGSEQLEYMKVVLCSVAQYAPELVERTRHLTHGLVKLPGNVKMSSRLGNFLRAVTVLELVRDALVEEYDSDDPRVMMGAIKYAFLKYKIGGNIVFDPKESVKMSGNSGPYLLYSCVRAKKILAKGEVSEGTTSGSRPRSPSSRVRGANSRQQAPKYPEVVSSETYKSEPENLLAQERELMKKILEYKGMLGEAVREMAPHKVAGYLYELAQAFSRFYEKCPVAGAPEEARRMQLVRVYLETMTHGLGLMGIEVPEEM